jgi:D-lactate dehydrogenase (cytochrome)
MIVKTQPDEIANFLVDASNFQGYCDAVYFPENEADVIEILKKAFAEEIPVTVAGNGTGLGGGRVPQGGIVIATEKMNRIIELNSEKYFAIVEPGVILSDLLYRTQELGLLYPPDPTEKNCFIGANIATNASGEKTFKYGPTRNYIEEVTVILSNGGKLNLKRGENKADGSLLKLQTEEGEIYNVALPDIQMPDTKNAAGYFIKENMDAIDLFIGSEGTLGIITKIKLKLLKYPENILSCVVFFNNEDDALNFIHEARNISFANRNNQVENEIDALALEFFDSRSLKFLMDEYTQIKQDAEAAVWFEQEVTSGNEDLILEKWIELIGMFNGDEESAWFAFTESDKKKIKEFRHAVSSKVAEFLSKYNVRKLGTDVAVPHVNFRNLYTFAKSEAERNNLNYVAYGHFGNSHLHMNILPKSQDEYQTGKKVFTSICAKAVELGGTISGEHGVGKLKNEFIIMMFGEENVKKMMDIKRVLDPKWILGRGNIFNENIVGIPKSV